MGDEKATARFAVLAAKVRAKLERALELTDMPTTVFEATAELERLDAYEAKVAVGGEHGERAAEFALMLFGKERAPLIDRIVRWAERQGKPWKPAYEARLDAALTVSVSKQRRIAA